MVPRPHGPTNDFVIFVADAAGGGIITLVLDRAFRKTCDVLQGLRPPDDPAAVREGVRLVIQDKYGLLIPADLEPSAETFSRRAWSVSYDLDGFRYTITKTTEGDADVSTSRSRI